MAAMGEMNPDLVRPARRETAFSKRCPDLERALDPIPSDRRFSPSFADDSHFFAIYDAAADVPGDLAHGWGRYTPDKGGVGAIDPARGEIARERLVRGLALGDDHQAARVLVEAVHNPRPPNPTDAGEAGAAMAQQGVDKGTVWVSRCGMDNHARRLVDDDQMCILEADIERDWLRGGGCRMLNLRENYDEILVVSDTLRGVAKRCSVLGDPAAFDQPFEPCPRQLREMEREHAIQALPSVGFAGADRG
jgi:hypothetical protein